MKRRRHLPLPAGLSRLRVEENEATGVAAGSALPPGAQYANLPLPHERDERTQRPGKPKAVTRKRPTISRRQPRHRSLHARGHRLRPEGAATLTSAHGVAVATP